MYSNAAFKLRTVVGAKPPRLLNSAVCLKGSEKYAWSFFSRTSASPLVWHEAGLQQWPPSSLLPAVPAVPLPPACLYSSPCLRPLSRCSETLLLPLLCTRNSRRSPTRISPNTSLRWSFWSRPVSMYHGENFSLEEHFWGTFVHGAQGHAASSC